MIIIIKNNNNKKGRRYYRRLITSRTWSIERYHLQRPWWP